MQTDHQSRGDQLFARVQTLLSVVLTVLALLVAYQFKAALPEGLGKQTPLRTYATLFFLICPIWYVLFGLTGYYRGFWQVPLGSLFFRTAGLVLTGLTLLLAMLFAFRLHEISRVTLGLFGLVDLLLLFTWHAGLLYWVQRFPVRPANRRQILVVGDAQESPEIIAVYQKLAIKGFEVAGFVFFEEPLVRPRIFAGVPVLGIKSQLSQLLKGRVIDEVVFAIDHTRLAEIRDDLVLCEEHGIQARIKSSLFSGLIAKTRLEILHGIPLLCFSTTSQSDMQLFIKAAVDRVAAAVGLIVAAPLMALIAMSIKLTSGGPVFFSQTRVGLNGRRFTFYKFRTMVANAESLRAALSNQNELSGPVFKIRDDPRITPLGGVLRRSSLDELPQLFNVLRGEMSLIGPRPPLPEEVEQYQPWQRRRLSMKPGLTCVWQVSGRNLVPFDRWLEMDLYYIDHWSLKLDLLILLRTIPVVVGGQGAC